MDLLGFEEMPRLATTISDAAPLEVVYSREDFAKVPLPSRVAEYPELRYMGSKHRLLPWIHGVLRNLSFETAADPFVGSGCVAYLLKAMGKRVIASDFLNFPTVLASATVGNSRYRLDGPALKMLLAPRSNGPHFIERTFDGIFYTTEDLRFLDRVSANVDNLAQPEQRALARAALIRSCLKKQPRGVFTVSGNLSRYDDGRRDLRLSIEEHFLEQVEAFNRIVFDNGRRHTIRRGDVFSLKPKGVDLVYLDPPYVPRSDDNCYMKRYHFLEGLSCYWTGVRIMQETRVKKIEKPYTPFSYRQTAIEAFDRLFKLYRESIIVLSYSSNGFPDREILEKLLRQYKPTVTAFERPHRYHFGTHDRVERAEVHEYLIVGR
ncbi:MAG TPA: DNA adenine methylase [Bryobacteraceae bacterium]|jgi:DNA adenine methylase/adenine-specific DNA-methyltransferase|nr:DNA adenine methylase [Bryobacteraceae bacterium]